MNTREGSEARAVAVRAFKWILSAYRPLELSEFSYAAAIRDDGVVDSEVDNGFVLDISSNFVTLDTANEIRFVHASVREFLEALTIDGLKLYSKSSVHIQAANTCLAYLTSSMFLSASRVDLDTGFPEYVRSFWALHCESCEDNRKEDKVLWKSLLNFMSLREVHPGFRRWHGCLKSFQSLLSEQDCPQLLLLEHIPSEPILHRYNDSDIKKFGRREEDCLAREPNPFLVACVFGFLDVVEKQPIEDQAMLNFQNSSSCSGFSLACKNSQVNLAPILLEKGASVNTKDNLGSTPLHFAVFTGNEALVRLLFELGADVDSKTDLGLRPLYLAVRIVSLPLVRMLLEFGANPNGIHRMRTCLSLAIITHLNDIAQLLREAGATG